MSHQPERALTRRHTGIDGGAGVCRNESSAREGIDTLCTPFATIMITEVEMSHQPERALTQEFSTPFFIRHAIVEMSHQPERALTPYSTHDSE